MKPVALKSVIAVLLLAAMTVMTSCSNGSAQEFKTVSVQTVDSLRRHDASITILDVRTPEEFNSTTGHLPQAKLIPVQELESRINELAQNKGKTIITYCRTGKRSATASGILSGKGFTVINMDGGITAWNEAQLPVERSK